MPPKLVIEGVRTGSPLYRAVAARFDGRLKQFHGKAQQQYAISSNDIGKLRWEWGDARASYVNIQGQEILHLEVDQRILAELQQEEFIPWDWIIVNFKVLECPYTTSFSATLVVPTLAPPLGVSSYSGTDGAGFKPMSFPDSGNSEFTQLDPLTVSGDFTAASLKADLRVVDPKSAVVIDVSASMATSCVNQAYRFPITYTIDFPANAPTSVAGTSISAPTLDTVPWYLRGNITYRHTSDCTLGTVHFYLASMEDNFGSGTLSAKLSQSWTIIGDGPDITLTISAVRSGTTLTITITSSSDAISVNGVWADDSTNPGGNHTANGWWEFVVAGATGSNGWVTGSFSSSVNIEYSNPSQNGPPPLFNEAWSTANSGDQTNYDLHFVPYLEATPDPSVEDSGVYDVVVAGIIGRGDPLWRYSDHTSDTATFKAWELDYPTPVPTAVLTTATLRSGSAKIGTIVADRHFGALTFSTT
jgi:hypothetical protein